jgi:signal transduction histidine kinase
MSIATILVVEDDGIIAMTLRNKLIGLGYDVPPTVFSGEEAVAKARELCPDVVLMDIHLRGEMDGIEAAEQIRAQHDVPVIYLTAYADEETLTRAKITEPYGYILKPYQERELQSAIEIALYKHQAERQLREAEAQLHQAEKLEAVGLLAAGVAHHFNNLMAIVVGYTSLLRDGQVDEEERPACLETILAAGEQAAALTRQLLAFSRKHMLRPEPYDLNRIVLSLREVLQRTVGEDIPVKIIASATPARAELDLGQIEQVLLNLAQNARAAMPQGGQLTIAVDEVTLTEEAARGTPEILPGPYVRLSVTDTGVGMDTRTLEHIFEPFFSTDIQRAGLGLSVVYGIVRQHGGWIDVQSTLGQGATFWICLPAIDATPQNSSVELVLVRGDAP